jgi:hypothetical protein
LSNIAHQRISWGIKKLSEKKREEARLRTKAIRDNAIWAKKTGTTRQVTPGVKIRGNPLFKDSSESQKPKSDNSTESIVTRYIQGKGGIVISEQITLPVIYRKVDDADVAEVTIARILGTDEKWGLERKFFSRSRQSIHAYRLPDRTVIEVGLQSYSGYVSRTYYVVDNTEFRAFAQYNFRKIDGKHE